MTSPDIGKLMAQAQAMQSKVAELQQKLALERVEGSAGGGMVTAVANGQLRIVELRIEPELFEGGDRRMLQDLVAAAVNSAISAAQRMVQEELQRISGGLQLDATFRPPGDAAS